MKVPEFKFNSAQLVLPVSDVTAARSFYQDRLGFETIYLNRDDDDPDGNFATLIRDTARLMLILDEGDRSHPWSIAGTGCMLLQVKNVEKVHQWATERGVDAPLERQPWGAMGFLMTDPSGNLIRVVEDLNA